MTSGNFASKSVESIMLEPRQRTTLTGIDELADSIRRNGLINPIVVTLDGVLVAGERRLAAVRSLGWTDISVQYAEDLDPLALQLIELEENTKRTDLDWKDQCNAVARYHELRSSTNPYPALLAAERGDTRVAVDRLIAIFDAGRGYYVAGNLFLHYMPELIPIRDDAAFQAVMRPKN